MARGNSITERIPVDAIVVGPRHRAINPDRVRALADSITRLGLRTPITVYDGEMTDEDGCVTNAAFLVAGAHRLEAIRALGQEEIDVIFVEPDPVAVKLWEIAENLHRSELLAVERAEHIDEWRRLTVAKEQQGVAVSNPLGGQQPHEKGIAKTADALGVSEDTVRRSERIAALPQETRDRARDEKWSRDRLLAATKPAQLPPAPLNDFEAINKQVAALMSAWNKAAPEAREKFLEQIDKPIMDRRFAAA